MGSPSSSVNNLSQLVNVLLDAYPRQEGCLVSLPTKAELQYSYQTIEVFIATIPLKSASTILKYVLLKPMYMTQLKFNAGSSKLLFKMSPLLTYSTWEDSSSQKTCPLAWGAWNRPPHLRPLPLSQQARHDFHGPMMTVYLTATRALHPWQSMTMQKLRNSLCCIILSAQHQS